MHILLPLLPILGLLSPIVGLTQPEVEAALRGQVPVRIEPFARPDGKTAGRGIGAITIDRPMGEVWTTLIRFEDKAEYMPRIKSAEVLEKTRERLRVRMVVDASVTTARYTMIYQLDEPAHRLSWKLDHSVPDNTIAEADGEYRVYEVSPGRTLVTYNSQVDTGRSLPRFIQNYIARRSIPDLLRAVKKRVESSGLWRR
jgi:carbon monoxide dehydrogenase subunit G